jgi:hypothetical protein
MKKPSERDTVPGNGVRLAHWPAPVRVLPAEARRVASLSSAHEGSW